MNNLCKRSSGGEFWHKSFMVSSTDIVLYLFGKFAENFMPWILSSLDKFILPY